MDNNMEELNELENQEMQDNLQTEPEMVAEEIIETNNEPLEIKEEILSEAVVAEPVSEASVTTVIVPEEKKKSGHKRILQGKVSSTKNDKTITVVIVRQIAHPLYKKYYKRSKKVMAHDEINTCRVGDVVRIRECRPLSAKKRWELIDVVERAK
jgi:small subunit ribosomal protein S17